MAEKASQDKFSQDNFASLLLVTHVNVRQGPRGAQIDDQTLAGIAQWCRYFDKVTYYGMAADAANAADSSAAWVDFASYPTAARCKLLSFPRAYRPTKMLKEYYGVRDRLREAVTQHSHLCFTIGGLLGDWPAVAAQEAIRQRRRYTAWIDRVEPSVIRNKVAGATFKRRLAAAIAVPIMERYTQHLLRNSSVALLQGRDTYDHYARFAPNPHCTYDTHTHSSDQIAPDTLAQKRTRILGGAPLKIVYIGRAAAMKGPSDWLDVLEQLHRNQVPFIASWIGDGPELQKMRARISKAELSKFISLPGFESDRGTLLRAMQESDLLLFCHKTPESPRVLIEALVSGCPLVGYETAYSRGLVQARGGGSFAQQDDVRKLTERIMELHGDRKLLAQLTAEAAASGELYNEDTVYSERARLMRDA